MSSNHSSYHISSYFITISPILYFSHLFYYFAKSRATYYYFIYNYFYGALKIPLFMGKLGIYSTKILFSHFITIFLNRRSFSLTLPYNQPSSRSFIIIFLFKQHISSNPSTIIIISSFLSKIIIFSHLLKNNLIFLEIKALLVLFALREHLLGPYYQ